MCARTTREEEQSLHTVCPQKSSIAAPPLSSLESQHAQDLVGTDLQQPATPAQNWTNNLGQRKARNTWKSTNFVHHIRPNRTKHRQEQ